jgi:hypothetical protein
MINTFGEEIRGEGDGSGSGRAWGSGGNPTWCGGGQVWCWSGATVLGERDDDEATGKTVYSGARLFFFNTDGVG